MILEGGDLTGRKGLLDKIVEQDEVKEENVILVPGWKGMAETRCVSRNADHNSMNVWRCFTEAMCKIDTWDYVVNIWRRYYVYSDNCWCF